ncbi:SRPBCC family protein [Streptomyces sp. C1-2]|uniref:SRPBCC family protein n=1 Tax=Streptomyces sp. C1-2 TaxID=2720022 RepID=UPI001432755B|nr:SRPBCC family protein [Streptomyces sp. C1-2]NJP73555.1 SRPBCC family protein [Streptomyces sp. C1-2]
MADTVGSAAGKATGGLSGVARSEAVDRLKSELQSYLGAQAERALAGLGRKLGETTGKLNDIAEGNSPGFAKLALDGGRKIAEGKGPLRSALELGAGRAKDGVTGAVKNLTGGGKGKRKGGGSGQKPTVILESVDVGVPLRTAYDQWTQYQDFSTFAKGVKSASRSDDTSSDWQMKVFWSNRSWKAKTTEQIPDDRISWSSEGAKGTTKGVVSFHSLGENLTRVLLVIEYYPSGLFEKTGNIWRAQGRRARLDLKNYVRFLTLKGEASEGWRGEIRDGEVVRSHEDAVAEEEQEEDQRQEDGEDGEDGENGENGEDTEGAEQPEDAEAADESEEPEEGYEDEEEGAYEDEPEGEYEEGEAEYEDSGEPEAAEDAEDGDELAEDTEPEEGYEEETEYEAEPEDERLASGSRR